jgi:cell division protein FtsL
MAKSRKNQSAAIRFGPALKALFLCLLIAGSAIGYVWQKGQNYELGKQIIQMEKKLSQLAHDNKKRDDQLAGLRSPVMLYQRARELGLVPVQPAQVVRLTEPSFVSPDNKYSTREFAARRADATTQ